jgi:hypothetical protein
VAAPQRSFRSLEWDELRREPGLGQYLLETLERFRGKPDLLQTLVVPDLAVLLLGEPLARPDVVGDLVDLEVLGFRDDDLESDERRARQLDLALTDET